MITNVKGTHDYVDTKLFMYIVDKVSRWLHLQNYQFIMTPILEPTELFKRSLGLQSDVVSKEMYTVTADEGAICLRPEATASTVRAFINNGVQTVPWKVYTWGPMFRHERPQKGRLRQFHQISIEAIGCSNIAYDAQFVAMLDKLFSQEFELDNYALQINFLGTRQDRQAHKESLIKFLEKHVAVICQTCQTRMHANTLRVFDCKNAVCQEVYQKAPVLLDYLNETSAKEWQQLQEYLAILGVSYTIQPKLVRGLDYYNKTVFEFSSAALGAQNAFCGGGRYDSLALELGAKQDQPSIGAGIGIERVIMMLEANKEKLPAISENRLVVVVPLNLAQNDSALLLASHLINNKITCETLLEDASAKSKLRKANSLGAKYALVIGPDEQQSHTVTMKNMITGEEKIVSQTEVLSLLS